ncbi:hypothetical protein ILYODFUR_034599 [Ilyodon furcidens]|uniref:Uncharacterized protein n=1 Tax=Ilyodon furcidens TaxID=33524 RepID=A0ABV0V987_9TELE
MSEGMVKRKRNLNTQSKEDKEVRKENMLAPEAIIASFQSHLGGINKQIQSLQNEMKVDLKSFKDNITTQMRDELSEFREDLNQKLANITTEMAEQNERINAVMTRTEEMETWGHEANNVLQRHGRRKLSCMEKKISFLTTITRRRHCNSVKPM